MKHCGVGEKGHFPSEAVSTFHSWAFSHISQTLGHSAVKSLPDNWLENRQPLIDLLAKANKKAPAQKLYDAIFIDEAQDLHIEELKLITALSERVALAGDSRQQIYDQDSFDGIGTLNLTETKLAHHYRIGLKICRVADRILPPDNQSLSLEAGCNYNEKKYGSSAKLEKFLNWEEQFKAMMRDMQDQLKAYPGETIAVISPRNDGCERLKSLFEQSTLKDEVVFHHQNVEDNPFLSGKRIHVLTAHAAKGTEFRVVNIFATETFQFPLNKRQLVYTAFTRAKTTLNAYATGNVLGYIESAFAEPTTPSVDDIFQ
jgi:superfamily I DNA/RNA helicase